MDTLEEINLATLKKNVYNELFPDCTLITSKALLLFVLLLFWISSLGNQQYVIKNYVNNS